MPNPLDVIAPKQPREKKQDHRGVVATPPTRAVTIGYCPHRNQYPIHVDKHRYRVVCAGRRFGKSVFARQEVLRRALMWEPGKKVEQLGIKRIPRFWIVSPTYRQGKKIHWEELKAEVPREVVVSKNETNLEIALINGAVIELKGGENEDALRGAGLVGVVLDECSYMKKHIWPRIIEPMLLETKGWAVFISTPNGPNWFKEIFQKGLENSATYDSAWKSWHFTSYDNPYVDRAEIEKKKRDLPEEEFKQEYMADFVIFKDLIYKDFKFDRNVIQPFDFEDFPGGTTFYRGIDFGFRHATACLWIAVTPEETWYIVDEFYSKETSTEHNVGVIKSILPKLKIEASYGDPTASQLMEDYENLGLYVTPAERSHKTTFTNWVKLGISKVAGKLKSLPDERGEKKPSLFIFNNCTHIIREFQKYRWKIQPDERQADSGRPLKRDDDCFDDKTEILTNEGWKLFRDLNRRELVATMDDGWRLEWKKPTRYQVHAWDSVLYTYSGQLDFAVSPNHNMLVVSQFDAKKSKTNRLQLVKIQQIVDAVGLENKGKRNRASNYWVPKVCLPEKTEKKCGRIDPYFLGFWLAEGCKWKTGNRKYVAIDNADEGLLLKAVSWTTNHSRPYGTNRCKRIAIRSDDLYDLMPHQRSWEKRIPRWFMETASNDELYQCFLGMMDGDGCWQKRNSHYDTTSKWLANDFQELLVRIGKNGKLTQVAGKRRMRMPNGKESICRPAYRVTLRQEGKSTGKYSLLEGKKIKKQKYVGTIYCVTVPNHRICVRRNGRVMWSGQCLDALRYFAVSYSGPMGAAGDYSFPKENLFKRGFYI